MFFISKATTALLTIFSNSPKSVSIEMRISYVALISAGMTLFPTPPLTLVRFIEVTGEAKKH